ncbi:hypothetical protein E4T44_13207 [Aureobasidium sp. EXF-8845]|nr:hypothetical protein E4T44_13207 [Aureobasidium sp. EXF-8845]
MLEDQSIQHLISWSSTNESFVMSPSTEFSKVLASYFKHTNISSFVRQLNMYGFHKGSPDSPLWEFKHGANNFRRGDLNGLRDIKRRASRHTLIHRDSFSNATPKMTLQPPPPPPPGAPMEATMPDPVEARLSMLEFNLQDVYARLARSEDAYANLSSKCQMLSEGLARCHYWSGELSSQLLGMAPDPETPIHRDVSALRAEINRNADILRSHEVLHENLQPTRPPYMSAPSYDHGGPVSPRQQAMDASRRPSLQPNSRAITSQVWFYQWTIWPPIAFVQATRTAATTTANLHDASTSTRAGASERSPSRPATSPSITPYESFTTPYFSRHQTPRMERPASRYSSTSTSTWRFTFYELRAECCTMAYVSLPPRQQRRPTNQRYIGAI